ncbi:hypothetical protein [Chitinophaga sp.]|uniref:hypothetical protein n=1 Tax=Chitinophaga sp. TaxID=1869181 RepID=UPI0031D989D1
MTRTYLFLLAAAALILASCSKGPMAGPDPDPAVNPPGNNPSNKLTGTWKFAGMELKGQSVTSASDMEGNTLRGITDFDYISIENKGTVTFDERMMTSKDISYMVDTKVKGSTYVNGELMESEELPWRVTIPASGSSASYELKANDSLYSQASTVSFPGIDAPLTGQPMACKLSWKGDTLVLKSRVNYTKNSSANGTATIVSSSMDQVTKLVRK